MDKLPLLFAAVRRLAQRSKDSDLMEYLDHGSHNSGAFIAETSKHEQNLKDLDNFTETHARLTAPGQQVAREYTQAEFDAAVRAAVDRAIKERGKEEGL